MCDIDISVFAYGLRKRFFSSKDPNHKCEWKTFVDNKATSCARGCGLGDATSRISSSSWDSVGNNLMFKCYEEVNGCQDPIKHYNIDIELIEPYGSL